jgi:phage repressor protein C with HTH and peptisase S24 domain
VPLPPTVADKLERAEEIRRRLFGDNEARLARELAIPSTSVHRAFRPAEQPPRTRDRTLERRLDEIAERVVETHALRPEWWETGAGPMLRPGVTYDASIKSSLPAEAASRTFSAGETAGPIANRADVLANSLREEQVITLYTDVAVADRGVRYDEATAVMQRVPRAIFRQFLGFEPPAVMGVTRVEGDLMEPALPDGTLAFYELVDDVRGGGLYVVRVDGAVQCSRVQKAGPDYRLIPDNKAAEYVVTTIRRDGDRFVHAETATDVDFVVVGKILWPSAASTRLHVQQVGALFRELFREGLAPQRKAA